MSTAILTSLDQTNECLFFSTTFVADYSMRDVTGVLKHFNAICNLVLMTVMLAGGLHCYIQTVSAISFPAIA